MESKPKVLIIDDDPVHLRIYGWIVSKAGYDPLAAQVVGDRIDFPEAIADLILLDFYLTGQVTALEAAAQAKHRCPDAPIVMLSDAHSLPSDLAPIVQAFVRKGEPEKLVGTLARILGPRAASNGAGSATP